MAECVPIKFISWSPGPQHLRIGMHLKMGTLKRSIRLLGWALSQYDWSPSKKKRSGHKHPQKKDHMNTQKDDGHLKPRGKTLRKKKKNT